MLQPGIAAQLYTVRELTAIDFPGSLGKIAAIGYRYVELAGFGNLQSAADVKSALHLHRLTCCSSHFPIEQFEQHFDTVLADAELIGTRRLVVPWLAPERRTSADDWHRFAGVLNHVGKRCHDRGFQLAYHHHAFEFDQLDAQTPFDIVWSQTDPRFLKAELDVYWLAFAGQDPVDWIKRLSDRVTLIHLKDMSNTPERRFAEVGAGILDFAGILEAARSVGTGWGIVEQDNTYGRPPIESLRISFDNLRQLMPSPGVPREGMSFPRD